MLHKSQTIQLYSAYYMGIRRRHYTNPAEHPAKVLHVFHAVIFLVVIRVLDIVCLCMVRVQCLQGNGNHLN